MAAPGGPADALPLYEDVRHGALLCVTVDGARDMLEHCSQRLEDWVALVHDLQSRLARELPEGRYRMQMVQADQGGVTVVSMVKPATTSDRVLALFLTAVSLVQEIDGVRPRLLLSVA